MRIIVSFIAFLTVFLMAGLAVAAKIPSACSAQAPRGAPVWNGNELPLTSLCRTAYIALHDDSKLVPDFVSWLLTSHNALGCFPRKDSFAPDPDLPPDRRAELADYEGQHDIYDRGHFAPNSDFAWDAEVQRESFYLSNMSPQASHLNQWEWGSLEAATRAWVITRNSLAIDNVDVDRCMKLVDIGIECLKCRPRSVPPPFQFGS